MTQSLSPALQPRARLDARGLGWSPFARRYSGSHCCFPFLRLLRCFSSSGWQPHRVDRPPAGRVSPFGHPRIMGRSRLPAAFRSLPRPSSPPGAKASPVRLLVLVAYRASPAALAASGLRVSSLFLYLSCFSVVQLFNYPVGLPTEQLQTSNLIDCVFPSIMSKNRRPPRPSAALARRHVSRTLWRERDSNPRPPACSADALAS